MRRPWIGFSVVCLLAAVPTWAEPPEPPEGSNSEPARPTVGVDARDADFYSRSYRQELDPRTAVRRKAEYRAQQRMGRLAALKWYGMSNSRPVASSTPMSSLYSPAWTSNSRRPFSWTGAARSTTVVIQSADPYWR